MMYSPTTYANLLKVITDKTYADEKYLIVKKSSVSDLFIIQYNKNFLNSDNIKTLGLFRSIIVDACGNIISFAPPKSVPFEHFLKDTEKSPNIEEDDIEKTEFCEGTMISLFWDRTKNDWELATKGNIGARCKFFQEYPKTFRYLFLEILTEKSIDLEKFKKDSIYSFVIQHPDNRIVVPFNEMDLKLIQIYNVTDSNEVVGCNCLTDIQMKSSDLGINVDTPLPINKVLSSSLNKNLSEMQTLFQGLNLSWKIVGCVFTDKKTGVRTKLRNPSYEYVKRLKGNNSKIQFQYYTLRQNDKVKDYLSFFPEKELEFAQLRHQLHAWTNMLYQNYIQCYIKKVAPLRDYPYEFRNHMFQIHQKYKEELRPAKLYVSKQVVVEYANTLPPPRLMYAINYKLRQNIVNNRKNDIEQITSN